MLAGHELLPLPLERGDLCEKKPRVDGVEVATIDGTLRPTAFVFSILFHHAPRPAGSSLSSTAAVNEEIASSRAEKRRKSL